MPPEVADAIKRAGAWHGEAGAHVDYGRPAAAAGTAR
jgi:hypothetical protein